MIVLLIFPHFGLVHVHFNITKVKQDYDCILLYIFMLLPEILSKYKKNFEILHHREIDLNIRKPKSTNEKMFHNYLIYFIH